ncbi:MAG TPA: winged helix-turn-helix domain-containing protein [Polyangiaceae bacterium]|nr:winged helix-turn-helix domain-containing protein [Polyangiaceae bacterium]
MKLALCPSCRSMWTPNGLVIDEARHLVSWPGGQMQLPPAQVCLFATLARHSGRVVKRERIYFALWGNALNGGPSDARMQVAVYLTKIRRAMKQAGCPGHILTHWGDGYELIWSAGLRAQPAEEKEQVDG